jgi:hypothetical protein
MTSRRLTAPKIKKTSGATPWEFQSLYEITLRARRKLLGAAPSTVEAVMYKLRTYGLAAIAGPNCQRRLADLSDAQLRQVIERLDRLRTKYPAITDNLLLSLAELIHEGR